MILSISFNLKEDIKFQLGTKEIWETNTLKILVELSFSTVYVLYNVVQWQENSLKGFAEDSKNVNDSYNFVINVFINIMSFAFQSLVKMM